MASAVSDGTLVILALQAVPNPNPSSVALRLSGPADSVELRVYSVAGACTAVVQGGPAPAGWSQVALPAGSSNGTYFVRVVARRGSQHSLPAAPMRLVEVK